MKYRYVLSIIIYCKFALVLISMIFHVIMASFHQESIILSLVFLSMCKESSMKMKGKLNIACKYY